MKKGTKSYLVFLFILSVLPQLSRAQVIAVWDKMSLGTGWRFHLGNAADPAKDFNFGIANIFSKTGKAEQTAISQKFSDTAWQNIELPHDWAVSLPFENNENEDVMGHGYKPIGGLYPENSIGWYRRHFYIQRADTGKRFVLQFDGIYRDSKIWVNGFYIGSHASGYTGISHDITDYLRLGGDNVIVVRVDASQYEGWFYEGAGIYRHAWLLKQNPVHIVNDGVFAYSTMQGNKADVHVETTVENSGLKDEKCSVGFYMTTRGGKVIASAPPQEIQLQPGQQNAVRSSVSVNNPKLWSLEDPYLYRIVAVVKMAKAIVDSNKLRFGVRSVELTADKGLLLNGKRVKIKGVNCHQDHAGVGTALPDYLQYYRIRLLKDMGANAYRTSHYPPTPELLDACDSLGMLVLDENRLLNSSAEYKSGFEQLIRRDRSRACVFLWSIGNEEGYVQTTSTGKSIAQTLLSIQKQLDPTRTSTYAADLGNVFEGINEVIPVRGFNYRQFGVEAYHHNHPNQPIVGTEMGSTVTTRGEYSRDTIRGYLPDEDVTAPWWASTAETWWPIAAKNDWFSGGFVWTGFDYRGEPTPYKWPDINSNFGMMDMCGFPKNIYYYYQSWWTDKDVLHISPHWNWKGKEGQPIDVWVNSNADSVELFLNDISLGRKDMPRYGHLQWQVRYQPGTLKAIAYKNGRKLTAEIHTTGQPSEVVLAPSKTTIVANGSDATVVNVSVVDKQGNEVPDADDLISFSVTGDAKIIGVGNGDPSSHEPDKCERSGWQRHLFNGKCQVIVQAGYNRENIELVATARGLYKGSTTIVAMHPGLAHNASIVSDVRYADHPGASKPLGKIIGADISFLPELEDQGVHFSDNGHEEDAIEILKDHGLNYIRLRIFNDPARDSGYSPGNGFCDLAHTLAMAKRIKALHLNLLLDFHYSDYWADPQQQYMPASWRGEVFSTLKKSLYNYTASVMQALKDQGTLPDMVQVGNEINHGMVWPAGNINNLDSLAQLIYSGIAAVHSVAPATKIMLHIALGGQNDESRFFLDNMIDRGVPFDVIGLSYYPKWHGTLDELRDNLTDLAKHYDKDVVVVEYSQRKREVNDIIFNVPGGRGKGAFIWEPLNTWDSIFEKDGRSNNKISIYDSISNEYNATQKSAH